MSIMEKLGRAADELGSAADEAVEKAKAKYEETVTPEKRAEIKDKFDKGMRSADEALTGLAETVSGEVRTFFNGKENK